VTPSERGMAEGEKERRFRGREESNKEERPKKGIRGNISTREREEFRFCNGVQQ
jgi:hypothetical protein